MESHTFGFWFSPQSRPRGGLDQRHNLQCPLGTILLGSRTRKKCLLIPAPQKLHFILQYFFFPGPLWAFNRFANCHLFHIGQHLGMLTALKLRAIAPQMKIIKMPFLLRVSAHEPSLLDSYNDAFWIMTTTTMYWARGHVTVLTLSLHNNPKQKSICLFYRDGKTESRETIWSRSHSWWATEPGLTSRPVSLLRWSSFNIIPLCFLFIWTFNNFLNSLSFIWRSPCWLG